jgi:DNA-binding MarR family transcriptional regulator
MIRSCTFPRPEAHPVADDSGVPDAAITASVLGRVIVQAGRVLDTPFAEILDRYELTRNAWWLLTELYHGRHEPESTLGEHARRCGLAASSATIAADLLTARKLTRRRRPKDNRRVALVTITAIGVAFVEAVRVDLEQAVTGLYDLYEPEDRRLLHDLLRRIIDADQPNVGSGTSGSRPITPDSVSVQA